MLPNTLHQSTWFIDTKQKELITFKILSIIFWLVGCEAKGKQIFFILFIDGSITYLI